MEHDYQKEFQKYLDENKTLAYMMLKRAEEFSDNVALLYMKDGEWASITWEELGEQIRSTAKALLEMAITKGDMIAIFSQNSPQWAIIDLGILSTRAVTVPIYATNSSEEAEFIINDAEVKIVFAGNQDQYDKIKKISGRNKYLKKIVAIDSSIHIQGEDSIHFEDILKRGRASSMGKELEQRLNSVESEDILTLIYTSGTTGNPKGAMHTHRSFMAGIFPSMLRINDFGPQYVSLAILPLSHVFERMWSYGCMTTGTRIAYCPDPKKFVEVMSFIRPHYLTSVPRIWEKVYGTIHEGLKNASPAKKKIFNWSVDVAKKVYFKKKAGSVIDPFLKIKYALADVLLLKKVRLKLGCERNIVYHVGGAAFASEINEFFQSIGINIIQGFGLTEFFPVCVGFGHNGRDGGCGPVLPMVDVRVSDEGEIQLKGEMAMKGYYKNDEATKESFTPDGWFKTQDVGHIEGDGYKYIVITDRIKDLIVTSGGKKISPQQIETLFGDEMFIEQIVVIGEGRQFISALIVPSFPMLEDYATKNKITFTSREDLLTNPEIIRLYEGIIRERTKGLGQVEQIKKFRFLASELTQDAGELTPTMKKKRKVINTKYRDIINNMYNT